jgi:hypothetical protein
VTTLLELVDEMAAALDPVVAELPGLQVYPYWNSNPTPPSIDFYPGETFQVGAGFGTTEKLVSFTVRARVSTADEASAQVLLLRLLDPGDPASVEAALAAIDVVVGNDGEVSGYRQYGEDSAASVRMLGCEWRVEAFL